jgi:preprotein translocase subunit SecD
MRSKLLSALWGIVMVAVLAVGANLIAGNTPNLGLDLRGGASVTLVPRGEVEDGALDVAVEVIRNRVDSLGVAEPEIVRQGTTVVVNLPGVSDQQRAIELVSVTGKVLLRPVLENRPGGAPTVPLEPGNDPDITVTLADERGNAFVLGPSLGTGEVLKNDAQADIFDGQWVVVVGLRPGAEGRDVWNAAALQCYSGTPTCPTRQLAIVLDDLVISAPQVQTPSFDNEVQITGAFTEAEARDLAKILEFGAVPVDFDIPTAQTVSATLGSDSLRAAIIAGLVGIALVILYLLVLYRLMALVVAGGLVVFGLLNWAVIALLSATNGLALTLAGATGIIVSIGIAVDSYIVYFERLKEELRAGRSLRGAAQRGFESAWRTITVANVASLLGSAILWYLTVGSVRGFAFFLGLATICNMITTYYFIRPAVQLAAMSPRWSGGRFMGVGIPETVPGSSPTSRRDADVDTAEVLS